jgi:hypothetical protein
MHSYIVRVYRRRGGREFSGTVEAVAAGRSAAGQPLQAPRAFASAADLLALMQARQAPPSPAPPAPCGEAGPAGGDGVPPGDVV